MIRELQAGDTHSASIGRFFFTTSAKKSKGVIPPLKWFKPCLSGCLTQGIDSVAHDDTVIIISAQTVVVAICAKVVSASGAHAPDICIFGFIDTIQGDTICRHL